MGMAPVGPIRKIGLKAHLVAEKKKPVGGNFLACTEASLRPLLTSRASDVQHRGNLVRWNGHHLRRPAGPPTHSRNRHAILSLLLSVDPERCCGGDHMGLLRRPTER